MRQAPRYPKTQSLWKRNMYVSCSECNHSFKDGAGKKCPNCDSKSITKIDGHGLIIPGAYTWKMFENISRWHVTEKIHGQNIRIGYYTDPKPTVTYWGRKGGEPSVQKMLLPFLKSLFTTSTMKYVFEDLEDSQVVLYGEGFGPGIQSWHYGLDRSDFILFDVLVGNVWLEQDAVTEIAHKLAIDRVPILGESITTVDAVMKCYGEPESVLAPGHPMEGIVARSDPLVIHRAKKTPIQWKLKVSDYVRLMAHRNGEELPTDKYKGF